MPISRVRVATSATLRAFRRWVDELHLKKKEEKQLLKAVEQIESADVSEASDTWLEDAAHVARVILLEALRKEISFETQRRANEVLAAIGQHVQALQEEERRRAEEDEIRRLRAGEKAAAEHDRMVKLLVAAEEEQERDEAMMVAMLMDDASFLMPRKRR